MLKNIKYLYIILYTLPNLFYTQAYFIKLTSISSTHLHLKEELFHVRRFYVIYRYINIK